MAVARRDAGEAPPRDAVLLINNQEFTSQTIIRRRDLRRYTGLGDSALDLMIREREILPFTLHAGGIASGVTGASLTAWALRGILRRAWDLEPVRAERADRAKHMRAANPHATAHGSLRRARKV
jgi:hypothetical protein